MRSKLAIVRKGFKNSRPVHLRLRLTRRSLVQLTLLTPPFHSRCLAKSIRRLEMDIDTVRDICKRDYVDIVLRFRRLRLDCRCFDESRKAFAIAIDGRIYPISNRYRRTGIREASVNVSCIDILRGSSVNECEQRRCNRGSNGSLHLERLRIMRTKFRRVPTTKRYEVRLCTCILFFVPLAEREMSTGTRTSRSFLLVHVAKSGQGDRMDNVSGR